MKKTITILFLFMSVAANSQLSSIVVRNDTTFSFNPSTGVYTQMTNLPIVPNTRTINGKVLSSNVSLVPSDIGCEPTITGGTIAQYLRGDKSLATFPTTTAAFANSTNKNFVTDAQLVVIGNTSGTNTGDQTSVTGNSGTATALQTPRTINGVSFNGTANITIFPQQVATADIAATASATATTTLFTPTADGMYRISAYMKITVAGTSPVAGPITITYTDADGSVAQSHVMLLASTVGAVVTTTVNNTTTTGTVYGSIVVNAKSAVAIQYAIAVSGTFGAGRYTAHLVCERLK